MTEDELIKKYPQYKTEIDNIGIAFDDLTEYFESIIDKNTFNFLDMFTQSVINRTNQCITAARYCLIHDLQFPLLNIVRQMIEILAINEYIKEDMTNFHKSFLGKKNHHMPELKLPNAYTLVQKFKKTEPDILKIYELYSDRSHPNSESVFSVFSKDEETEDAFTMRISSHDTKIELENAHHIIRNIGGIANRICKSIKEINSKSNNDFS